VGIQEICIIAIAGFCSGVIKTGVGIGSGIFLLPTLTLAFPAKIALGLGAPIMLASDVIGLCYYWRRWAPKEILAPLFIAAVAGLLTGTVLLPVIPANSFRAGVGIFGMLYAVSMLWPAFPVVSVCKKVSSVLNERHVYNRVYIYGAVGGLVTVLAHAGGLVWSLYLLTELKDKRIFVGTTILLFFFTNIYKTVAYIYLEILSVKAVISMLPVIPAIFIGNYIGNRANLKLNNVLFKKIVLIIIFIVSFKMCL
jgi:uncharacterized membrane protein YfcA